MSNAKTALYVKGTLTPRFLIWCHGYIHGKITHTGELDSESNKISSGYVTSQIERFYKACAVRCEKSEQKLSQKWAEGDHALMELAAISIRLKRLEEGCQIPYAGNGSQARAEERAKEKRTACETERQEVIKKITDIRDTIRLELNLASQQMEATKRKLLSTFSTYGHGLLLKPINLQNLPDIGFEKYPQMILEGHSDTWDAISTVMKEAER